jgi:uncharacterized integral membrane protein (TIGR00697 family)
MKNAKDKLRAGYGPLSEKTMFPSVGILFVATLLTSNIAAQKLFACGPFTFSGGILVFPISYVLGDVLTEVYGYARARQIIWAGLAGNFFMAVVLWIVITLAPAAGWTLQDQFAAVLGLVPRIVLASVVAYWAGEFSNSFVLAKLKILTKGRALWLRTISSTMVGQAVDTALFVVIGFAAVFPGWLMLRAIWSGWAFKVAYEAAVTPLTYMIVNWLKRREGIDTFDTRTRFTPFRLAVEFDRSIKPADE